MPPLVKNDTAVPGGTGLPNRSATWPSTGQMISKSTWPAMLTKPDATDKWAAEGGPPVMLTFVEELVRVFVPTVTLALIRTGPATVPLVNTVEASPATVPWVVGPMNSPPPRPLISANDTCVLSATRLQF